ncbi:MAG: hypothetical protein V1911_01055 [Candidatus Micrarchaeota archaeon]
MKADIKRIQKDYWKADKENRKVLISKRSGKIHLVGVPLGAYGVLISNPLTVALGGIIATTPIVIRMGVYGAGKIEQAGIKSGIKAGIKKSATLSKKQSVQEVIKEAQEQNAKIKELLEQSRRIKNPPSQVGAY